MERHVEIEAFLDRVDVVVVPSRSDALPMVLLQAMAAERPVVATRVGGIPEAIDHGVHGLLVEPGDAAGIAQAIAEVLRRPDAARARAWVARRHIERQFSSSQASRAYRRCYTRVLDGASRHAGPRRGARAS